VGISTEVYLDQSLVKIIGSQLNCAMIICGCGKSSRDILNLMHLFYIAFIEVIGISKVNFV